MEHEQPKYQQMAAQVVQAIQQGALRPGQRLPSVREWARQFGVSHNTALQAMRTLEDERWIEPRARSGFYVSAPRAAAPELHALEVLEPRAANVEWCLQRLQAASSATSLAKRSCVAAASCSDVVSCVASCPACSCAMRCGLMSKPITGRCLPKATAKGRPT